MPRAALSRQTYGGFRDGKYSSASETCSVAFGTAWDLAKVEPDPFPVPSAVVFGTRAAHAAALPETVLAWSGHSPVHGTKGGTLTTATATVVAMTGDEVASVYKEKFRQGAILVPRMLIMVTDAVAGPLGVPQGRRAVQSRKTTLDNKPWKALPPNEGVVEEIFVRPAYLGESIAPFRILSTPMTVIPYDGTRLMDGADDRIDRYPGLAAWWRLAEEVWLQHRNTATRRTLIEQLDYIGQLSAQFPVAAYRVVYTASGNTLAAALVRDRLGIVEHSLYWAPVMTLEEAHYLTAILNAPALSQLVRPFMSVGAFGPRHFDKYVWQAPIPVFDPDSALHAHLVSLADEDALDKAVRQLLQPPG